MYSVLTALGLLLRGRDPRITHVSINDGCYVWHLTWGGIEVLELNCPEDCKVYGTWQKTIVANVRARVDLDRMYGRMSDGSLDKIRLKKRSFIASFFGVWDRVEWTCVSFVAHLLGRPESVYKRLTPKQLMEALKNGGGLSEFS